MATETKIAKAEKIGNPRKEMLIDLEQKIINLIMKKSDELKEIEGKGFTRSEVSSMLDRVK